MGINRFFCPRPTLKCPYSIRMRNSPGLTQCPLLLQCHHMSIRASQITSRSTQQSVQAKDSENTKEKKKKILVHYKCNPTVTDWFLSQRASDAGRYSMPWRRHGPLTRYVKLRVPHAPWMPGKFSPPPRVSNPDMHHGTFVTHVPWCMLGSLASGFLWSRWWVNVPGIPGACSTHNFTYPVRGTLSSSHPLVHIECHQTKHPQCNKVLRARKGVVWKYTSLIGHWHSIATKMGT